MATRRTKRTRQIKRTRRGSGPYFTQPMRRYFGFDRFGPSTSLLAGEIYNLFKSPLTPEEKDRHLRSMLQSNKKVNQKNLLSDLHALGIKKHSTDMFEIEAVLNDTLPKHDSMEHT